MLLLLEPHRGEGAEKDVFFFSVFSGCFDRAASSGMIIIGDTDDDDDDDEEEDDEDEEEDDDEEEEEDSDDDDDDDHDVTDVTSSSGSSVEGKEKGGSRWGKEELPLTEDLTKKTVQVRHPFRFSFKAPALCLSRLSCRGC